MSRNAAAFIVVCLLAPKSVSSSVCWENEELPLKKGFEKKEMFRLSPRQQRETTIKTKRGNIEF